MNKIIILKNTEKGIVADTVELSNASDTLSIDLGVDVTGNTVLEIPDKTYKVVTPGKDGFDYFIAITTLIGIVITMIYTVGSIRKLFKKDEQKEDQINKLTDIVAKIEDSNQEALRREKHAKRPFIELTLSRVKPNNSGGSFILRIVNKNLNSNIIKYDLVGLNGTGLDNYVTLTTGNNDNQQEMGVKFSFTGKNVPQGGVFSIEYETEEGFEYIQELSLTYDCGKSVFNLRGLGIILKENAKA